MISQQNLSNSTSAQSLSLDDLSKYFNVPLSDAASNLGVCVSVLKRICRENGLDRWPYRKVLAGKSIEDIKKHAARERRKELAVLANAGGQSGSPHPYNENSKVQGAPSPNKLQQGSKDVQVGRQQITPTPVLAKVMTALDEFKYGFPSDGLSVVTNKWWGSSSPDDHEGIGGDGGTETDDDDKYQPKDKTDDGTSQMTADKEKPENGKIESDTGGAQGTGLLTSARKRAVEEGREALKLGVYKTYGVNKLGKKEKALLLRIFGSSLPNHCIYGSS